MQNKAIIEHQYKSNISLSKYKSMIKTAHNEKKSKEYRQSLYNAYRYRGGKLTYKQIIG